MLPHKLDIENLTGILERGKWGKMMKLISKLEGKEMNTNRAPVSLKLNCFAF